MQSFPALSKSLNVMQTDSPKSSLVIDVSSRGLGSRCAGQVMASAARASIILSADPNFLYMLLTCVLKIWAAWCYHSSFGGFLQVSLLVVVNLEILNCCIEEG